jgi:hypothetical protein
MSTRYGSVDRPPRMYTREPDPDYPDDPITQAEADRQSRVDTKEEEQEPPESPRYVEVNETYVRVREPASIDDNGSPGDPYWDRRQPIRTAGRSAFAKRAKGQYTFARFRDAQLLSLCSYEAEIETLQEEINVLTRLEGDPAEDKELLISKFGYLRRVLDYYSTLDLPLQNELSGHSTILTQLASDMIKFHKIMRLQSVNNNPELVELNFESSSDPIRGFFQKIAMAFLQRKRGKDSENAKRSVNMATMRAIPIADNIARFVIAIVGGSSLLVPVILMAFLTTRTSHLIITSVFTIVFAIAMSFISTASNQEVLGSTAAYAAVLVVFVGTSTTGA